jgi:hypothetical protein
VEAERKQAEVILDRGPDPELPPPSEPVAASSEAFHVVTFEKAIGMLRSVETKPASMHSRAEPDESLREDRRGELPEFFIEAFPKRLSNWLLRAARGAAVRMGHIAETTYKSDLTLRGYFYSPHIRIIGAHAEMHALRWRLAVANKTKIHQKPFLPQDLAAALPTKRFADRYGVHPSTVWRAVRDGRLQYVVVGRRKLILPPVVQTNNSSANPPPGKK